MLARAAGAGTTARVRNDDVLHARRPRLALPALFDLNDLLENCEDGL
jgi:hypothetical protein